MMNKKEKLINDIEMNCEANKLIILDKLEAVKNINSKEEVREAMTKVLNLIDKDETNEEAIERFFIFIDEVKDKTNQLSYKDEAEDTLLEFIFSNRDIAITNLEVN